MNEGASPDETDTDRIDQHRTDGDQVDEDRVDDDWAEGDRAESMSTERTGDETSSDRPVDGGSDGDDIQEDGSDALDATPSHERRQLQTDQTETESVERDGSNGSDDGSNDLDPAEEVEAAVERVMGPDALDESEDASQSENDSVETDGTESGAGDESIEEDVMEGIADDVAGIDDEPAQDVPADVRKYDRFKKIDGGTYDRANEFLRDRTYITAREWAMARLCADFRTETGVEMTKIGENLPELVPFMTDTYTPQAVNQARAAFEDKVRKAGATFLYGAMCDFFTAEELDDVMYEATEVAKFLLEVEGVELSVDEELAAEDHISAVMREVREQSAALRHDTVTCPECGHGIETGDE